MTKTMWLISYVTVYRFHMLQGKLCLAIYFGSLYL